MTMSPYPETDPRHHTTTIKGMLDDLITHVRGDVTNVSDPRAEALFETTAEVLGGLKKAYDDYERRDEPAWHG